MRQSSRLHDGGIDGSSVSREQAEGREHDGEHKGPGNHDIGEEVGTHCYPVQGEQHDEGQQNGDEGPTVLLANQGDEGQKGDCGGAFTWRKRAVSGAPTIERENGGEEQVSLPQSAPQSPKQHDLF